MKNNEKNKKTNKEEKSERRKIKNDFILVAIATLSGQVEKDFTIDNKNKINLKKQFQILKIDEKQKIDITLLNKFF